MARLITIDPSERSMIGGFVMDRELHRRRERDREDFIDRASRYRGREYVERMNSRERSLDIDVLSRRAMRMNAELNSAFKDEQYEDLRTVEEFRNTGRRMQDLLLSVREVYQYAINQRMETWGRSREEFEMEDTPRRYRKEYRQVYHGMGVPCEEDPRDLVCESFIMDDDDYIGYDNQRLIHDVSRNLLGHLKAKFDDPTSRYGNFL